MKPASLKLQKVSLRNKCRCLLKSIKPAERKTKSRLLTERILRAGIFHKAKSILAFMSLPSEPDIRRVIRIALARGKKVYLPCTEENGTLRIFGLRRRRNRFKRGAYGILEPERRKKEEGSLSDVDLILVPGLGFDRQGRRLGRGKAYFDRFLKKSKKAVKVGIAFQKQIIPKIPIEKHDVKMNFIVTEKTMISPKGKKIEII